MYIARGFQLDLDVIRETRGPPSTRSSIILATFGGDFYSQLFGSGQRRWLNPHLGARVGTVSIDSRFRGLVGVEAGVEIYKGRHVLWDAGVRGMVMGAPNGRLALGVQPGTSLHVAF